MNNHLILLVIYLIVGGGVILTSCTESKDQTARNKVAATVSPTTEKVETVNNSTSEENSTIILNGEKSEEVTSSNSELGVSIYAPSGMIRNSLSPKLKIDALRDAFPADLPGKAILLDTGKSVEVSDNDNQVISSNTFSENFTVKAEIPKSSLTGDENISVLVRSFNLDNEPVVQVLPPASININPFNTDTMEVSFKAFGKVDFQIIDLKENNLFAPEVFIPTPPEANNIKCLGSSPYSGDILWGLPGGSVAAFSVIHSTSQTEIENATNCEINNSPSDIPATATSFRIDSLTPNTDYYVRVCTKNQRRPVSDISPGTICTFKTPIPGLPILHTVYEKSSKVYYGLKTAETDWNVEQIATGMYSAFELDKKNVPSIVFTTYDGSEAKFTNKKNGTWNFDSFRVDELSAYNSNFSVAFTASDELYVAGKLKGNYFIANKPSSTWNIQTTPPYHPFYDHGLNIDSDGKFLAIGYENYQKLIFYEKNGNSDWTESAISISSDCQSGVSSVGGAITTIDQDGNLHGVYTCQRTSNKIGLYYFSKKDIAQHTLVNEYAFNNFSQCRYFINDYVIATDIMVDKEKNIHIAYVDGESIDTKSGSVPRNCKLIFLNGKINYATKGENDSSFITTTVLEKEDYFKSVNLIVDLNHKLHLIYNSRKSNNELIEYLNYATNVNGSWETEAFDQVAIGPYNLDKNYHEGFLLRGLLINDYRKHSPY